MESLQEFQIYLLLVHKCYGMNIYLRVFFVQQTVDANVNFNAREGRSTVEVCKQFKILLCMFFSDNMLEKLLDLSFPPSQFLTMHIAPRAYRLVCRC
jgi:hypothetical protein